MRYLPDDGDLDGLPHLRIGAVPPGRPAPVACLGCEPGLPLPAPLLADTSTGVALAFVRQPNILPLPPDVHGVTTDTFDGDRLLAIWALLNPDAAHARAALAEAVARAVSFGICTDERVRQITCLLRAYPAERGIEAVGDLYRDLLPRVTRLLDAPRDFDLYWIGEYSDVLRADALLNSGAVQIDEYPDLDLTVIETPLRLHDLTRLTAASHLRVLTIRSENTYTLEYRRESWVPARPRRPLPRIDLRSLAARLNLFERAAGRWRAEPITDPTPSLHLDDGRARPAPSSIDAETIRAEVRDYLRDAVRRPDLHWTPTSGRL